MPWGSLRGHDRVVAELRRAASHGRLPHALLFVGPDGVGKRLAATRLAMALLCDRHDEADLEACGTCFSCKQIVAGSHPDVLMVAKPEEKHELPIDAIRKLVADLGLRPSRGSRRVAIVDDADDLSPEAANSFLKTLEEPPSGAVLILVGTSPDLQLDTIRSRCRVVRFDPLPASELAAVLLDRGLIADRAEADRLAALGEGSVGRALALAGAELVDFRRAMLDEVARGFDAPGLARRVESFVQEAGKESAPRRERARLLIGELARLIRAAMWAATGQEAPMPDPADRRAAVNLAARLDPDAAADLVARCLDADYHIVRKAHVGLTLDSLFHDLGHRINARRGGLS
jgi:DNA polymerase-3 subunit delta'